MIRGGFFGVGFGGFDFHGGERAGSARALEEDTGNDEGDLLVQDVTDDEAEQAFLLLHEEGPIAGVFESDQVGDAGRLHRDGSGHGAVRGGARRAVSLLRGPRWRR